MRAMVSCLPLHVPLSPALPARQRPSLQIHNSAPLGWLPLLHIPPLPALPAQRRPPQLLRNILFQCARLGYLLPLHILCVTTARCCACFSKRISITQKVIVSAPVLCWGAGSPVAVVGGVGVAYMAAAS
eukprot:IDg17830t1